MRRAALVAAVLLTACAKQDQTVPGGLLADGMKLHYFSDGNAIPPWPVGTVELGVAAGERTGCSRLVIQRGPSPSVGDSATLCLNEGTLVRWDAARSSWSTIRPVRAQMRTTIPSSGSTQAQYETEGMSEDTISGTPLSVVVTTVTVLDSTGKAVRRLRERYSLGLATATRGEFSVPDSAAPGGWRVEQLFELRRIEKP